MREDEIQNELTEINKKLANAFIDNLSGEDYGKLLDRKLELMHQLFKITFNKEKN